MATQKKSSLKRLHSRLVKAGIATETLHPHLIVVAGPTGYHGGSASHAYKRLDDIHQKHGAHTPKAKQFINNRTNKTTHPDKLHQWHEALTSNGYHEEAERVKQKM